MLYATAALLLGAVPATLALQRPGDVGRLPALGWNSWNAYQCGIDADKVMTAANTMVSKGFKAAGYSYVNIDDCWSVRDTRDNTTQQIIPDSTKFPDGIKGIADQVHALGFKMGIYSSAGLTTCAGYPASYGYEEIDAATFAAWGIDYLKYDNCGVPQNDSDACYSCVPDATFGSNFINGTCTNSSNEVVFQNRLCDFEWPVDGYNYSASKTAMRYQKMSAALQAQNRTILYSLCEWGSNEPWTWGNATANSWRTTDDISPNWGRISDILNQNSFLSNWGDFTGHNDPDMLEVGNGNLTTEESRSHFALWAMMKSPLLIGTDLTALSQTNIDILLNKYLLAFNQDPVNGKPAQPYKWGLNPDWTFNSTNPAEFWSGSYGNGTLVAMLNTLGGARTMVADFNEVPELRGGNCSYKVTDAWTGADLGAKTGSVSMNVSSHDTAVLLVQEA